MIIISRIFGEALNGIVHMVLICFILFLHHIFNGWFINSTDIPHSIVTSTIKLHGQGTNRFAFESPQMNEYIRNK